ncbi:MAG: tRNA (5-methylaminomethyl-2-thiouridine)(34)-methyltransferase MnmD [Bacteroidota bacterium]
MSNLQITKTSDGSDTLFNQDLNQHYHSTYGAVRESQHIFIESGFLHSIEIFNSVSGNKTDCLNIIEIGFGTGLNALLTQAEAEKHFLKVHYTAIEAFPVCESYWQALNYPQMIGSFDHSKVFTKLHQANWNEAVEISPHFTLHKILCTLESYQNTEDEYDLVYFDAFGPDVQPELWTEEVFIKIYKIMVRDGVFVTYSVKGTVVRALRSAGFTIEKLPGPPGKRHILRAIK